MFINGRIVDEQGEPMFGAHVYIPSIITSIGTKLGTMVNLDGTWEMSNYRITNNTVIVITYIGYKTIETTVGAVNNKTLVMNEDFLQGNLVTVTGNRKTAKNWNWLLYGLAGFTIYKLLTKEKIKKITI